MSSDTDTVDERRTAIRTRHREAAETALPEHTDLYVGGEFVVADERETFDTVDPTTGEVLESVARGTAPDVDAAVDAAWTAFDETWSEFSAGRRQRVLTAIGDTIEDHTAELATLESLDNGKPISEAKVDVRGAAEQFRFFAGIVRENSGETMTADSRHGQVIKEPYGVVGQIIPWNFPLLMASWKLAPALAAGNCSVLKPAEQTPLSALRLAELIDDVVPDGVVNVVPGYGEEAGVAVSGHPDVRKVAFTGSTAVGKQVMKRAADTVTDVTLELGGKSPVVVFPDVNPKKAVALVQSAIFYNTGECCEAGSRLFVHEDIADEVLDGLVAAIGEMTIGDPLDKETDLGPKVSQKQVDRTLEFLESAREDGGEFLAGGGRPDDVLEDGCYVEPTLIEGLDHDSEPAQEEIFGPVLDVFRWDDYDEMIELANDVAYGLAGGVVTDDITTAHTTARDIDAGYIWINSYHDLVPGLPFGGYKQSGIGRELSGETLDHYQQTKTINLSLR
ncbi:aldehyde dehydrogenase family protein [Natronobacterium gregoryi]|uniref:Aldehyde Dehydrogenase n=3 Tax=cellular organisms TaxID=131567 RepID=L0AJX4_NATGS|nr:aldehyde dehydrogenase family protein [Natronobacterium gregoryi]AFZ73487.1 NAD-dependent aldehyde dehydrogenase [Natronobacterium gregoryi SP2]ELY68340.1 Aldehyde Dehydrogenase [Natronobacterium gregoryi SP2]PLK20499.1 betaine-aldehyde dehydrogenase [Natronobacterium gregoryi SP2]SFI70890.1 aldehyde dehydrogenase (acceptor) [Natronobacterium gregoryi]